MKKIKKNKLKKTRKQNKNIKKIRCKETGDIFNNMNEALEWLNYSSKGSLCLACQGKRHTCGMVPGTNIPASWEYVEEV